MLNTIEAQFGQELQGLLDKYKNRLSTPTIMRIAQPIFSKTIGFKDNPERLERVLNNAVHNISHMTTEIKGDWVVESDIDKPM